MEATGMLSPYRVLDLADEQGYFCGKMLADIGADVIKIEPHDGDPSRRIGPFFHDEPDPEKSLSWIAFNAGKRSITLNLDHNDGRQIFNTLVKTADFVIESFPPGYMEKLGYSYVELEKVNPRVILVSISPFGQAGPYRNYKGTDLITWGMSGNMYHIGDVDRAPLAIGYDWQSYLNAAGEAAVGAILALYHRSITGQGQWVDISTEEAVARLNSIGASWLEVAKRPQGRGGSVESQLQLPRKWRCKDGWIVFTYWGGPMGNKENPKLIDWMDKEGMATDYLKTYDWILLNPATITPEMLKNLEEPTRVFFQSHTKDEIFTEALKREIMAYPVSTPADLLGDIQLAARDFWIKFTHPKLKADITYPGAFARISATPPVVPRRAPDIGEHNREIYEGELGISLESIKKLMKNKVI